MAWRELNNTPIIIIESYYYPIIQCIRSRVIIIIRSMS